MRMNLRMLLLPAFRDTRPLLPRRTIHLYAFLLQKNISNCLETCFNYAPEECCQAVGLKAD